MDALTDNLKREKAYSMSMSDAADRLVNYIRIAADLAGSEREFQEFLQADSQLKAIYEVGTIKPKLSDKSLEAKTFLEGFQETPQYDVVEQRTYTATSVISLEEANALGLSPSWYKSREDRALKGVPFSRFLEDAVKNLNNGTWLDVYEPALEKSGRSLESAKEELYAFQKGVSYTPPVAKIIYDQPEKLDISSQPREIDTIPSERLSVDDAKEIEREHSKIDPTKRYTLAELKEGFENPKNAFDFKHTNKELFDDSGTIGQADFAKRRLQTLRGRKVIPKAREAAQKYLETRYGSIEAVESQLIELGYLSPEESTEVQLPRVEGKGIKDEVKLADSLGVSVDALDKLLDVDESNKASQKTREANDGIDLDGNITRDEVIERKGKSAGKVFWARYSDGRDEMPRVEYYSKLHTVAKGTKGKEQAREELRACDNLTWEELGDVIDRYEKTLTSDNQSLLHVKHQPKSDGITYQGSDRTETPKADIPKGSQESSAASVKSDGSNVDNKKSEEISQDTSKDFVIYKAMLANLLGISERDVSIILGSDRATVQKLFEYVDRDVRNPQTRLAIYDRMASHFTQEKYPLIASDLEVRYNSARERAATISSPVVRSTEPPKPVFQTNGKIDLSKSLDATLTNKQAADVLGVNPKDVNRYVGSERTNGGILGRSLAEKMHIAGKVHSLREHGFAGSGQEIYSQITGKAATRTAYPIPSPVERSSPTQRADEKKAAKEESLESTEQKSEKRLNFASDPSIVLSAKEVADDLEISVHELDKLIKGGQIETTEKGIVAGKLAQYLVDTYRFDDLRERGYLGEDDDIRKFVETGERPASKAEQPRTVYPTSPVNRAEQPVQEKTVFLNGNYSTSSNVQAISVELPAQIEQNLERIFSRLDGNGKPIVDDVNLLKEGGIKAVLGRYSDYFQDSVFVSKTVQILGLAIAGAEQFYKQDNSPTESSRFLENLVSKLDDLKERTDDNKSSS